MIHRIAIETLEKGGVDAERVSVRAVQTTRNVSDLNKSTPLQILKTFRPTSPILPFGAAFSWRGRSVPASVLDSPFHRHGGGHVRAAGPEVDPPPRRGRHVDRA